jgi:hypothetical protein
VALQSSGKKKDAAPFDPMKPVLSFKTKEREFKLGLESNALIGADSECRIQSAALPGIAGMLLSCHGRPYLSAARFAEGFLSVNGADASAGPRELTDGAVVSFGQHAIFTIAIRPLPEATGGVFAPAPFKGNLALLDISDNRFGSKLILPPAGRSIMIGRDASNHFMIESLNVSKKHAQLIIYDNSVLVLDAHSTNGTYLEEEPIAKKLAHPGEIVRFADKRYLLCHSE